MQNVLGIASDSLGNLYIADEYNNRIREVSGGIITTFAGGGTNGLGDGGQGTSAALAYPEGVAFDSAQNAYIADHNNNRVRKLSEGTISTLASVSNPIDVAVDPQGNVLVVASGISSANSFVAKILPNGSVTTIAGLGILGYFNPNGVTTDPSGDVYFSDSYAGVVRELTPVPTFCTYSLGNLPIGPGAGGIGTISVTAAIGCNWTAYSGSPSATISSGGTGSGNGTVSITFTANNTGSSRSFTLAIAGQVISIAQPTSPSPLAFFPLTPCRVADTRQYFGFSGAFGPPFLSGGAVRSFPIQSSGCSVPATAQAYSLNVTVVPRGKLGYLTVWPTGSMIPEVSTLNAPAGNVVANAAIVLAGTGGAISLFASDDTDVLIDINGYFAPPGAPQALAFYPVTPCRVADTRLGFGFSGQFGQPSLIAGATRSFGIEQSPCGIPPAAQMYSVRMTAVAPGPLVYLTTWPEGQPLPNVSTLNAASGGAVGNQALVPAGTDDGGPISVYASNNTDLLIDINGYFAPPGDPGAQYFYLMTPCRVVDTRLGFGFSGSFGQPSLAAGGTRSFPMSTSSCGIPNSAQAYSLNMTAVVPSGRTLNYLTAFPFGQTLPNASTVNAPQGGVVGSAAILPAGTGGSISVFTSDLTDLLIDINGYFAP
jgi:hypothetical protein